MNINVSKEAIAHFWDEPPAGSWEFWAFRFKPPCRVGDGLVFKINNVIVASSHCRQDRSTWAILMRSNRPLP